MTNQLYVRLRGTAERLIRQNGKTVTFTRTVQGAFDPATGTTTDTTTTVGGVGAMFNYRNIEIDGQTIQASDRKMIYSGEMPMIDDIYDGWRAVQVDPLDPDESGAILYTVQLRK